MVVIPAAALRYSVLQEPANVAVYIWGKAKVFFEACGPSSMCMLAVVQLVKPVRIKHKDARKRASRSTRGVFGCHAALVLRRLRRLCAREYQSRPVFVVTSATIANPQEHVQALLGALQTPAVQRANVFAGLLYSSTVGAISMLCRRAVSARHLAIMLVSNAQVLKHTIAAHLYTRRKECGLGCASCHTALIVPCPGACHTRH